MSTLNIIRGTSSSPREISYQVIVTDEDLPQEKEYRFAVVFPDGTSADERLSKIQSEAKRYLARWKSIIEVQYDDDDSVISTQVI